MAYLVRREMQVCQGLVIQALLVSLVSLGHQYQVQLGLLDKKGSREKVACPVHQV